MPPRQTRRRNRAKRYPTRNARNAGSKVLDVRSKGAIKGLESVLGRGPLTLVFVYADWCGACHKFRDDVWSPLTQLKNATMNRVAVREDMISKTSLANVQRKFYPTILLVGKDKKAATFQDEDGQPTNAMPRKPTLAEDREALSTLVQAPASDPGTPGTPANDPGTPGTPGAPGTLPVVPMRIKEEGSIPRSQKRLSPYEPNQPSISNNNMSRPIRLVTEDPEDPEDPEPMATAVAKTPTTVFSGPPDVASDLVRTQKPNGALVGGARKRTLLDAIRKHTASLRAVLNVRKLYTRRTKH